MKNHFLVSFLLLSVMTHAQEFTFVSDRIFETSADLLGYTFFPATIVYPDKGDVENSPESDLGSGDFSFNISQNYLYIEGEDIEGVYSINSINPTEYGYIIATMNARNPMIQGHLKITLNNEGRATGLIFKKSTDTEELVFKLADIPQNLEQIESEYFTNINNSPITTDIIWNRTYHPFFRIGEKQQRLRIEDSVTIAITLDSVIIIKKKKEKIVINRAITITYKGFEDNGNRKDFKQVYEIKGLKERQSVEANAKNDKYLIEIEVKGLPEKYIYFYLNQKRAVTMIELGPNRFLIRGL